MSTIKSAIDTNYIFIEKLRSILVKLVDDISVIEMTSNNYDNNNNLIRNKVPTTTTNLCEIGSYDKICYFVYIIESSSFNYDFLKLIIERYNVHIYGYKNFNENYYPKKDFDLGKFKEQIKPERYFQIELDFDITAMKPDDIANKYQEVSSIAKDFKVNILNQFNLILPV